jgi:hypothetical protein
MRLTRGLVWNKELPIFATLRVPTLWTAEQQNKKREINRGGRYKFGSVV